MVSFYEVGAMVHLYSATGCTFTEPLHPILKPGLYNGGQNPASLIITPVNHRTVPAISKKYYYNHNYIALSELM